MQTMQTCRPLRKRANTWACSEDFFFSFFGLAIPPFSDRSPQVVLKVFGILYSILSLSLTPYRWVYIVYTVYTVYQKREKIMENQRQKAKNFKSISKLTVSPPCTAVYTSIHEGARIRELTCRRVLRSDLLLANAHEVPLQKNVQVFRITVALGLYCQIHFSFLDCRRFWRCQGLFSRSGDGW